MTLLKPIPVARPGEGLPMKKPRVAPRGKDRTPAKDLIYDQNTDPSRKSKMPRPRPRVREPWGSTRRKTPSLLRRGSD